jgi:hypothetical protein
MIASAPGTSLRVKFPPSQRNIEIFRFLVAEAGSTREAAAQFGVSQTRVRQIARQVALWASEALPPGTEAETAGLLRVAEATASDRLQHYLTETMEQWRANHQPKFLNLALRLTMAAAKLPERAFEMEAAAAEMWEAESGDRRQESGGRNQDSAFGDAPDGDCSLDRAAQSPMRNAALVVGDVNREPASKLGLLLAEEESQRRERISTARTLLSPFDPAALEGASTAPESLGISVEEVLQRRARKNRQAR